MKISLTTESAALRREQGSWVLLSESYPMKFRSEIDMKMIYILNTPILTDYGNYDFFKISLERAKAFMEKMR